MSKQVTQSELNQVLEEVRNGFRDMGDRFNQLDNKVENVKTSVVEVDKRLVAVETKVDGLDKRLSNLETSVQKIPELAEKVGEFKWWKQTVLILSSGTIGAFIARIIGSQNP